MRPRPRYAVAAGFVVVVVALIVVRDEGYLGGRTDSGPLRAGRLDAAVFGAKPGQSFGFTIGPSLRGAAVEIQAARPDFMSPGLGFRAARISDRRGPCGGCAYPRSRPLFVGSRYEGDGEAIVGLRAERPGAYYALGLVLDYKRGIRRFRHYATPSFCLAVGREARCQTVSLPDADLAEVGGPSGAGRITLTNLSRSAIEVADLTVEGGVAEPEAFRLRPGAGRSVRLTGCERVRELRARVDGDEVGVPLTVAADCASGGR